MTETYGLTFCSSLLVLKSKLLHRLKAQHGFVQNHSRHNGKNIALRAEKPYHTIQWCYIITVFYVFAFLLL